ncbi:MAG: glycosyltransferase family 4 protein [Synechococcus sp. SB0668_bin_15]|nr:glycosyltransferase family 4 protein [Synechococcus sp. SB0668_bin_15]MYC49033.1 glycosyltransferase family 4 protein [Synechococcus sp. SB0662_bin_14]
METPGAMRILVVSTAVGPIGQGRGGGVEVTVGSLVRGLVDRGHQLMVLAPEGSEPCGCPLRTVAGQLQPPWQQQSRDAPIVQPPDGVLANLWREAWILQGGHHVVLNLGYDWLPLWLGPCFTPPVLHLISMGSLSQAMDQAVADVARTHQGRLAFHSRSQMESFGIRHGVVVGNGFDLDTYRFVREPEPLLGWVGRIAPEKGLGDAAAAAAALHRPLAVWGRVEDPTYKDRVMADHPACDFRWQGFLPPLQLRQELGRCAVLLMTPRWQEAFGNVVVEAMACGVPVVAYRRGGPQEIVDHGLTGFLVEPGRVGELAAMVEKAYRLDRHRIRRRCQERFAVAPFAQRLEAWILAAL